MTSQNTAFTLIVASCLCNCYLLAQIAPVSVTDEKCIFAAAVLAGARLWLADSILAPVLATRLHPDCLVVE